MSGTAGSSDENPNQPPDREPTLRVVPMPSDVNVNGDIFGGWIMAQVDVAGGTVAGRVARGRVATVAVNSFTFKQPVQIVGASPIIRALLLLIGISPRHFVRKAP